MRHCTLNLRRGSQAQPGAHAIAGAEVIFEADGHGHDRVGNDKFPEAVGLSAARFNYYEVQWFDGPCPAVNLPNVAPSTRSALTGLTPPKIHDLRARGIGEDAARMIIAEESYRYANDIYPYGNHPPPPRREWISPLGVIPANGAAVHTLADVGVDVPEDAPKLDADAPEGPYVGAEASSTDEIDTATPAATAAPTPAKKVTRYEARKAELQALVSKRGGGGELQDIADKYEVRGSSKSELADGILAAEFPDEHVAAEA